MLTLKNLRRKIRYVDFFGKPIMLNFNKKGENYQTIIGGIISILIMCTVFAYSVTKIIVLINKNGSSSSSIN